MAELNSDLPQIESQGSVGGISPNLEAITAEGRGIEAAGQAIDKGGSQLYDRVEQKETADVYAGIAYAREKYTENLNNAIQSGNLDTEQFSQQLKDDTDKIGEGLSTPGARNFFQRQQARLTGAMLLKASHVSGQIAANQSIDNLTQAGNSLSNTAMMDPTQFPDMIDQNEEMIDAAIKNGQLPEGKAESFRQFMNTKIADGAAKGLAQMDPGKNSDGTAKENMLLSTLKNLDPKATDNSSLFKYLNADQISNLQAYARRMDEVRKVQEDQVESNQDKLLRTKGQVWLDQHSSAIMSGQVDPKNIINNPNLTLQQKEMGVETVRRYSKESVTSDPSYVNHVESQIINGEIVSRDQIVSAFNSSGGKMSADDTFRLFKRIDETPDGKIVQNSLKQFYRMGDQELRFKGAGGAYTASGDTANYNFRQELNTAATIYVQNGKGSLRDFYSNTNPKDPDSPVAILNKYRMNAMQKAEVGAKEAMGQANGMVRYSTSPTRDIPEQPQKTTPTEDMIKPGESIIDWKKRTKRQ